MTNKEVCWNITARCNQNCLYCHRFLNVNDLSFSDNLSILVKLKDSGVNSITWTGGEALLLDGVDELLGVSYKLGIKNKLITNGKLLTEDRMNSILKYLDSLTLSIDSVDNDINLKLGRGINHFEEIKNILDYISENKFNTKININSVVCKDSIESFEELNSFLEKYNINSWRIFKFMPLREKAIINKDSFNVSEVEFDKIVRKIKSISRIKNIETRVEKDMETKYILILANGDIVVTHNGKDEKVGNALFDKLEMYDANDRV